jgi:putative aldouronate transport system permease protein
MIISITFFRNNLSAEILEAAKIDGCSNTGFFFRIAIPLSGAIIAILVLYYGVGHWNSYFNSMIYLSSPEKWPLQLILRKKLILSAAAQQFVQDPAELQRLLLRSELMKYTLIIVSSAPIMCLYPFIQKHFVKGVMIGSVKG